jgi:hypothetical protein
MSDERVDNIARLMTKGGYLEAAAAFTERAEEGYYTDVRLDMINRFWTVGR